MGTRKDGPTLFEQGQDAGHLQATADCENPFPAGSVQHRNSELGRRFGIRTVLGPELPPRTLMTATLRRDNYRAGERGPTNVPHRRRIGEAPSLQVEDRAQGEETVTITPSQCRGARGMLGWSQGQLARAAGVTKPLVASFEAGGPVPNPRTVRELRVALETTGISFLNDTDGEGFGLRLKALHDRGSEAAEPAIKAMRAMDAAIEEHRISKTKR